MNETETLLQTTPLHALHTELGGRMVPFAGYEMPVQYANGILKEHLHTRSQAGLFDVSHMGQVRLDAPSGGVPAEALETLVPGDIQALRPGRMRYSVFTNTDGGILDDLMITHAGDHLFLVVNAACKDADIAHLQAGLGGHARVTPLPERALLALQGPAAAAVLARFAPAVTAQKFMTGQTVRIDAVDAFVTRSGYTGEDGFELSVPADHAEALARRLLDQPEVALVGLGARDSLRLEAGLCLYGHDIDTTTTPVEADLAWTIGKRRRREGGYPGAAIIAAQIEDGPPRRRVGLRPAGRAPAREGTEIAGEDGSRLGVVTSGGFGPSAGAPVAMGMVPTVASAPGTRLSLMIRGRAHEATVVPLPFVPHRYARG